MWSLMRSRGNLSNKKAIHSSKTQEEDWGQTQTSMVITRGKGVGGGRRG